MPEPLLMKRLHISGLTPSISPEDLERRLSSFGNVKAMDGFGARDALGDPRKFGFVTIEVSAKELARCLNVLSGSTWKGAKLRIGEAKPDFRERLAQINSRPPHPARPKRTRARDYGHPSSTLPLAPLSATAAASTPGWIMTPSGRVVRPMRMRPERPLEPMRSEPSASKVKGTSVKVKKQAKPPPVRARRRLIDPTKWDSVYLRGVFLDSVSVPPVASRDAPEPPCSSMHGVVDEEGEERTEDDDTDSDAFSSIVQKETKPLQPITRLAQDHARAIPSAQQSQKVTLAASSLTDETSESIHVRDEVNAALAMLGNMFGDKEDWDGRESVDEMGNLDGDKVRKDEMQVDEEDGIEIVPRDCGLGERSNIPRDRDENKGKDKSLGDDGVDLEAVRDADVEMDDRSVSIEVSVQTAEPTPRTNLKALFAPREEASFSLLDHLDLDLDLDLELDTDILGISARPGAFQENGHLPGQVSPTPHDLQIPAAIPTTEARSRVTLDPSLPLLFPLPDSLPHPHISSFNTTTAVHRHDTPTCFLFPPATRVRGLHQFPPSITFTRSPQDTSESIRERWEKDKSSLTHEWKKAWRDARGSKRGKVGTGGEVGGGY